MELLRSQNPSELVSQLGSLLGLLTVAHTMLYTLLPMPLRGLLTGLLWRLRDWLSARYHYVEIPELDESTWQPNELYAAIKLHISTSILQQGQGHGSGSGSGSGLASAAHSRRLRLSRSGSGSGFGFTWSPCNGEVIPDAFDGARLWWEHYTSHDASAPPASMMLPMLPHHHQLFGRHIGSGGLGGSSGLGSSTRASAFLPDQERRNTYILKLHRNDKDRVLAPYMDHILAQARELKLHTRERLLFTNNARSDSYRHTWDSVPFKHPSTFETLALDPDKKRLIMEDLLAFSRGEDFYKKTGRAWKRGYLLYGPPGTGKSSLIAAMANLLRYDVYDLELTQVRSNGELRKLLLRTTSKSIIVIEDIDCSLELGNRIAKPQSGVKGSSGGGGVGLGKKQSTRKGGDAVEASDMVIMMNSMKEEALMQMQGISGGSHSAVTLSGLLNFTDGLWSCCGDERIFVFTTNHIESLDPALLRSGRMDMHIFMSYCTFPAFKILASNYLGIEDHPLFVSVESAMSRHNMTPAEVSEIFIRNKDKPPHAALEELVSELLCSDPVDSGCMAEDNGGVYDDDDSMQDVQELVKQAIHPMLSNSSNGSRIGMNGDGDDDDDDGLRLSCTDNKLDGSHEAHTTNVLRLSNSNRSSSKNGDGSLNCPHCKGAANTLIQPEGFTELECDDKKNRDGGGDGVLYVDHSHGHNHSHSHNNQPCDDKAIVAHTKDGRSSS